MRRRRSKLQHHHQGLMTALLLLLPIGSAFFPSAVRSRRRRPSESRSWRMVLTPPAPKMSSASFASLPVDDFKTKGRKVKRRYRRKRIPETERELKTLRRERQAEYERLVKSTDSPSIWSFESLFPDTVWDEESVKRDLYSIKERDEKLLAEKERGSQQPQPASQRELSKMKSSFYGGSAMMRIWREPKLSSAYLPNSTVTNASIDDRASQPMVRERLVDATPVRPVVEATQPDVNMTQQARVDKDLTRMVEDRIFGFRRTNRGYQYDTSLMGDGAVQFRDGVRLGNPLKINADRLNYLAKKELQHGRVEEATELYEQAVNLDPRDGRAYLGLSRCAQRRSDFKLAREYLQAGIANSITVTDDMTADDRGGNPFLLQALGCLEERMGRLSQAEALYAAAARSRPSHAAAWVSLAQLRTRKLGQSANAGRVCFQAAERELKQIGARPSSYVYTAWASMEYKKAGDARRARELFKLALEVDPKCSAAWLQLGVMQADRENWKEAQQCFESVLKFDQRNSRVLQAYALMETKRPNGSSRKAIDLFERALKANSRDAGVLQAYGLYVAELGDIDAARNLLRRGTEVNKRHAPAWQAWGVLETRHGTAAAARNVFQQGIWACAQLGGSQSGGYRCARLWQAWGVLEARENDHAAARRCFSRALDADSRNVAAVTAWAKMEEEIGNLRDARSIFERSLPMFAAGSDDKVALWRSYELMEQRCSNTSAAQQVYQRAMREAMTASATDEEESKDRVDLTRPVKDESGGGTEKKKKEVEVLRWDGGGGEIWLNGGSIETKVPFDMRNRRKKK